MFKSTKPFFFLFCRKLPVTSIRRDFYLLIIVNPRILYFVEFYTLQKLVSPQSCCCISKKMLRSFHRKTLSQRNFIFFTCFLVVWCLYPYLILILFTPNPFAQIQKVLRKIGRIKLPQGHGPLYINGYLFLFYLFYWILT